MNLSNTKLFAALLGIFMVASPNAGAKMAGVKDTGPGSVAGFEVGNGRNGLDTGGFEIGNGRSVIEVINNYGKIGHSIKLYNDFDFVKSGETTWATGYIAGGKTKATINLGVVRDESIPTLSNFLVEGLKQGLWTVINLAGLPGLKKDVYDEKTNTYTVEIELHLKEGSLLVYQISSTLDGLKDIQAISNSIKVHSETDPQDS